MSTSRLRAENGQGSIRWINERECECIIQSQYLNPKTGKPKRFKRKYKIDKNTKPTRKVQAETEEKIRELTIHAKDAWEKELIKGNDVKIDKSKTYGEYMKEFLSIIEVNLTGSG